ERREEARLADAGRSREADHVRVPRVGVEQAHEVARTRIAALDQRDRAREGAGLARADALGELLGRRRHTPCTAGRRSGSIPRVRRMAAAAAAKTAALATPKAQRAP